LNSGNFFYCLNVSTVVALNAGTVQTFGLLQYLFLICGSTVVPVAYYTTCARASFTLPSVL